MRCAVIFGGSGFIGTFFSDFLIRNGLFDRVYIYDLESWLEKPFPYRRKLLEAHGDRLVFVRGDVREEIDLRPDESVHLVANFAAVHREPGHDEREYFETNLYGAENVTRWADSVGCNEIIFTSSISPYGISEDTKTEATLPVPVTAYGSSKLVAEKIHLAWQARDMSNRKLVIVRPGVVFGPGEGGNVSRLVRAVRRGYFFYMGNHGTRKAGIYVKELCHAIWWVSRTQFESPAGAIVFNGTMNPGPSISEYVGTVCKVSQTRRFVPSVPYSVLLFASHLIDIFARPLRIEHPFSPVRIRKLVRSNNILPNYLVSHGYSYKYSLEQAMLDWKSDCPEEWT